MLENTQGFVNDASHAVGVSSPQNIQWYIAVVRLNTERSSSKKLAALGYEVFLPVQKEVCLWKNGRKRLCERVLFPGIIFIRLTEEQRRIVVALPYIDRFMVNRSGLVNSYNRHPLAIISEEQIEQLKLLMCKSNSDISVNASNLKIGDKVRVVRGDLIGLEGHVCRNRNGHSCLAIILDNIGCATVKISLDDIVQI